MCGILMCDLNRMPSRTSSKSKQTSAWLMTFKRKPKGLRDCFEEWDWNPGHEYNGSWSCGVTKRMCVGDRFFLLVQGKTCSGIVAHGRITSSFFTGKHWDKAKAAQGAKALYVKVMFEEVRNPFRHSFLHRDHIKQLNPLRDVCWNSQSSGTSLSVEAVRELDRLWSLLKRGSSSPEKVPVFKRKAESLPKRISTETIRFTRNRPLADQIKAAYNYTCQRCSTSVLLRGGKRHAEAAHLQPLKDQGSDTADNMLCLCPNCHTSLDGGGFQLRGDELFFRRGHKLKQANIDYYNRRVYLGLK